MKKNDDIHKSTTGEIEERADRTRLQHSSLRRATGILPAIMNRAEFNATKKRGDSGRHTPRMPNFLLTLFVAILAAFACAWLIFVGLASLAGANITIWPTGISSVAPEKIFELTRSTVTAAGLLAGVFAIVYAYRKQKIEEANSNRADAVSLGARYQDSAEKLGHDSAPVRLAGVYSLSRLADEDSSQRETICRLLCGYLRIPYDPSDPPPGEREVRHSVIKLIAEHLKDPSAETNWCGYDLDFSGATFDGGSFSESHFIDCSVDFSGCRFSYGKTLFDNCTFENVHVDFGDGESDPSIFDGGAVHFIGADFKDKAEMTFIFTEFKSGSLEFGNSRFHTGSSITFGTCEFDGAYLSFGGPIWGGARLLGGKISLSLIDIRSGGLSFMGAEFSGSSVSLSDIKQTGGFINFDDASFNSGKVTFENFELLKGAARFNVYGDPRAVVSPWPLPTRRHKLKWLTGAKSFLRRSLRGANRSGPR